MSILRLAISLALATGVILSGVFAAEPVNISGIYPHLAMFNGEAECGTGAVVPWANRLWVITYGPHLPFGSSDKLYEITPDLVQIIRDESIGGTPANRLIHRESQQLAIGPYLIDAQGKVRTISYKEMPGRLTGTARHLVDPAGKLYYATMEEGLYEVDVRTLAVKGLIKDGNKPRAGQTTDEKSPATIDSKLPGYHGKGLYSGQGRLVYANNGEHGRDAQTIPTTPSGALAEWRPEVGGDWQLVRRNQFTEVTGPGGIFGNETDTDPIWSIGWDAKSLILMCLDGGNWHSFRLPKASHSYDGAHGWNTEWPRIRDIGPVGQPDLMMTMHGTFWRFPITFSAKNTAGIRPRSNYLKVVGDFCRWNDRIVLGCDDTAKSEFLNKRKIKGGIAGPGQSHSNLWFVKNEQLDQLGPVIGRGSVWLKEGVQADTPSDPFLVAGYARRSLFVQHDSSEPVQLTLEVDEKGTGTWRTLEQPTVDGSAWMALPADLKAEWIRLRVHRDVKTMTASFLFSNESADKLDARLTEGIARHDAADLRGGLVYVRGAGSKTLRLAAKSFGQEAKELACYDLDAELKLKRVEDPQGYAWAETNYAIPQDVIFADKASVIYIDEQGKRWRLPKGSDQYDKPSPYGAERVDREVCTERDLMNVYGTFFELPAENAGGIAKVRPVATHNRRIHDYCSYRGMLVISGLDATAADSPHIIKSDDGQARLWVGVVDDLWKFGKPRGKGGPWLETAVKKGEPSDPYLMTGYDRKQLRLSHNGKEALRFRLEADCTGYGDFAPYKTYEVPPNQELTEDLPPEFTPYWIRVVAEQDCTATAQLVYE
jgi:hypothetical protein